LPAKIEFAHPLVTSAVIDPEDEAFDIERRIAGNCHAACLICERDAPQQLRYARVPAHANSFADADLRHLPGSLPVRANPFAGCSWPRARYRRLKHQVSVLLLGTELADRGAQMSCAREVEKLPARLRH